MWSCERAESTKAGKIGLEQAIENLELWILRIILSCLMYLGLEPKVELSNILGKVVLQK